MPDPDCLQFSPVLIFFFFSVQPYAYVRLESTIDRVDGIERNFVDFDVLEHVYTYNGVYSDWGVDDIGISPMRIEDIYLLLSNTVYKRVLILYMRVIIKSEACYNLNMRYAYSTVSN